MSDRLPRLDHTGLRVGREDGRLVDWAERPPPTGRPYDRDPGARRQYQEFDERRDETLRQWTAASQHAGISRIRMYDELSALTVSECLRDV